MTDFDLGKAFEKFAEAHIAKIDERLQSVLAINQRLIDENLRLRSVTPSSVAQPVLDGPTTFGSSSGTRVYMSKTEYGYEFSGKTYDVKDKIKELGSVSFDKTSKSWKLTQTGKSEEEIQEFMKKHCEFEVLRK